MPTSVTANTNGGPARHRAEAMFAAGARATVGRADGNTNWSEAVAAEAARHEENAVLAALLASHGWTQDGDDWTYDPERPNGEATSQPTTPREPPPETATTATDPAPPPELKPKPAPVIPPPAELLVPPAITTAPKTPKPAPATVEDEVDPAASDSSDARTAQFEGWRAMPYICPAGKATIGYGIQLPITRAEAGDLFRTRHGREPSAAEQATFHAHPTEVDGETRLGFGMTLPISERAGLALLRGRAAAATADAARLAARHNVDWAALPVPVKTALADMSFNMGAGGLNQFKQMWAAAARGDWAEMSRQVLTNGRGGPSQYARDVGRRADANAELIASAGDDPTYHAQTELGTTALG